jgi:hypothetical protein
MRLRHETCLAITHLLEIHHVHAILAYVGKTAAVIEALEALQAAPMHHEDKKAHTMNAQFLTPLL